jgi:CD63 antigen
MLVIVGSILNSQFTEYFDFQGYASISSMSGPIIVIGIVITIISLFGCTGAFRQNRCMILTVCILERLFILN